MRDLESPLQRDRSRLEAELFEMLIGKRKFGP
jgi:hypothetical protein